LRELSYLGLNRQVAKSPSRQVAKSPKHDIIVTVKATASPFTLRVCWPAQLLESIVQASG
jgi:hypothetical protein